MVCFTAYLRRVHKIQSFFPFKMFVIHENWNVHCEKTWPGMMLRRPMCTDRQAAGRNPSPDAGETRRTATPTAGSVSVWRGRLSWNTSQNTKVNYKLHSKYKASQLKFYKVVRKQWSSRNCFAIKPNFFDIQLTTVPTLLKWERIRCQFWKYIRMMLL